MTSDTPTAVTIEEVMAATGLTKRQVFADVRAGLFPGRLRYRQYICPRGEWERWLAGDWQPRPQPEPLSLIRRKAS